MKNIRHYAVVTGMLLVMLFAVVQGGTVKSAGVKGLWSQPATWVGNTLPGPADLVVIANRDTVTIDTTFTIAGLTVGEGDSTGLVFSKIIQTIAVRVNGDVWVKPLGRFSIQDNTISKVITDSLFITGNLTNDGARFDMSSGSVTGPTLSVCQVCFVGSTVSTIKMGPYTSTSNNEFRGIWVNKSGKGKVVLASDVYSTGGSTSATTADPIIQLTRGVVETGPFALVQLYAAAGSMVTGSDSSYILGNLGRGITNSGTANTERTFQVGDQGGYRPMKVRVTPTGANVTGHYVRVDVVHGKANPAGMATFDESIDKVSDVRYYKIAYYRLPFTPTALQKVNIDRVSLSYGKDDGVTAGNKNLRIAITDSSKLAWVGMGPTVKTHTVLNPDTVRMMTPDSLPSASWRSIDSVNVVYVALSRLAGSTENTLVDPTVYVRRESNVPGTFTLEQNYPNPFNPATSIKFSVKTAGFVSLRVYDVLGREVAALVDDTMTAGTYTMTWDASKASSGVYFYTLRSGQNISTKRMTLIK